ncbi:MAG: DUF3105 domain-containing protein [Chloroflexota bacterium]|nr:DUF3105 domain-containing protein [Chloroflexota bacterium]
MHASHAVQVAVLLALLTVSCGGSSVSASRIEGVQTFEVTSSEHVKGTIGYPQDPPIGGPHNPVWQNCGFYNESVPKERAVHSMEHGAVWITYAPDLPADQIETLRALAERPYVLAAPYQDLTTPVVASAWGNQLRVDGAADPRLETFVEAFANGPQTPEPGAPCHGGVGEPT